ncbi:hypothetical protein MBLNU230_g3643t1 [Neophaeotheca triangularis]
MILRSLRLRHGRIALPRPSAPSRLPPRRFYATEVQSEVERYNNPFSEQQYVESGDGGSKSQAHQSQEPTAPLNNPDHPVAQEWAFFQHQKARTGTLGADIAPHYRPHELLSNPPRPKDITLELLLASQSHLGHATSLWNPANARYIFGIRDGQHIISLDVTAAHLRRACKVVSGVTARGGLVLFVGTRDGQARSVVKAAEMAGGCHLFDRWIPGSITNGEQILGRCQTRVVNAVDQEQEGFEGQLEDRPVLKPDLVICLNPMENYVLLHECGLNNIPTIGIIDTDANPTWVTYPIPANDDSLRCTQVIAGALGRAGEEGKIERFSQAMAGKLEYVHSHKLEAPGEGEEGDDAAEAAEDAASQPPEVQPASDIAPLARMSLPADRREHLMHLDALDAGYDTSAAARRSRDDGASDLPILGRSLISSRLDVANSDDASEGVIRWTPHEPTPPQTEEERAELRQEYHSALSQALSPAEPEEIDAAFRKYGAPDGEYPLVDDVSVEDLMRWELGRPLEELEALRKYQERQIEFNGFEKPRGRRAGEEEQAEMEQVVREGEQKEGK